MTMNEKGISLIFAVIILLIFGLLAAVLASLVSTDADIAFHEFRSAQAQYVADGGIEYALKPEPVLNKGIFPNYSIPPYSTRGATPSIPLGDGSFVVDPPTVLTAATGVANPTPTISVVSTAGFADPATTGQPVFITIWSGTPIKQEVISCTGITATTFTTCTRGVVNPPNIASHPMDSSVYPITTLSGAVPGGLPGCGVVSISVNPFAKRDSTTGFLPIGVLRIQNELIHYTGVTLGAGDAIIAFTGITRCYKGSCTCPGASGHSNGTQVFQYVITSTGTVPTGIIGNAQRVVRVTVGQ